MTARPSTADQNGGSARGYLAGFAFLAASQSGRNSKARSASPYVYSSRA
jgi:hypothetical protein